MLSRFRLIWRRNEILKKPILKFENVGLAFSGRSVLSDVSFGIERGELVALLGPSGCGKTTILNIIAGFLKPTSGYAFIDERLIDRPGPDRGVVFQSYALFDWMTVRDNISFSLRCRGASKAERVRVADAMISLVGLKGFGDYYPYDLSGGMRQRCGLARVLAANPNVMLMDEPFAAVDVQTRETLQEEILRVKAETRCTILFVTHSIDEAAFLADRIFLLTDLAHGRFEEYPVALPEPRANPENRISPEFLALRERIYLAMRGSHGHASNSPGSPQ